MIPLLERIGFRGNDLRYATVDQLVQEKVLARPMDGNHGELHPKTSDFVSEGIPFLMASDIEDSGINISGCSRISIKQADYLRKGFAKTGDVLLTHKATIGRVAIVGPIETAYLMLTPQITYYRVRDSDVLSSKYLATYFRSSFFQETLRLWADAGSTRAYLGITAQGKLPIVFPSIAAQRKIAAILTAYDDLIENNKRRIALLEKMAEEIYREWFVRLRFPGHASTPSHKGIPDGWRVGRLGDIANLVMGQSPSSEHYNENGDGLPFHQGVGTYGDRCPHHVTWCSVPGRRAQAGSVLFSVRAPVGRINIADCDLIIGRGLAAMNERAGRNSFLFYLLRSYFSSEDLIGNGSIFASVGKDELLKFPIYIPPHDLINRFEAFSVPIDRQIAGLYKAQAALRETRDLLLGRLISGKLRVDQLDIQFPPSMREST